MPLIPGVEAILDSLIVAAVGLSGFLTTERLRVKGVCFSSGRSRRYLGPELHDREGKDTLDNEPVDPSGPLEVTLACCVLDLREELLDHPVGS